MLGFSCPPHVRRPFSVLCCAKWLDCILNRPWVERQTCWIEGVWLSCSGGRGMCVSGGSGTGLWRWVERITMTWDVISSLQLWSVHAPVCVGGGGFAGVVTKHTHKARKTKQSTRTHTHPATHISISCKEILPLFVFRSTLHGACAGYIVWRY